MDNSYRSKNLCVDGRGGTLVVVCDVVGVGSLALTCIFHYRMPTILPLTPSIPMCYNRIKGELYEADRI